MGTVVIDDDIFKLTARAPSINREVNVLVCQEMDYLTIDHKGIIDPQVTTLIGIFHAHFLLVPFVYIYFDQTVLLLLQDLG